MTQKFCFANKRVSANDDEDIVTVQQEGERLSSGGWMQEQKNNVSSGRAKLRLLFPGPVTPNRCAYYWVTAPLIQRVAHTRPKLAHESSNLLGRLVFSWEAAASVNRRTVEFHTVYRQ